MPSLEWPFFIAFSLAFFFGSIPTAYWLGQAKANLDIRKHGSGNIGATNAFRVLGKKYGILVLLLDFLKGFLPLFIFIKLGFISRQEIGWVGLGAILGHIFTPFLNFKGGKGIAVGAGVMCAAYPLFFIFTISVWLILFFITHIVSLSSVVAVGSIFLLTLLKGYPSRIWLFFLTLFLISIWTHRANLERLMRGEEKKLF